MLERACSFGRDARKNLLGVLTLPLGEKRRGVAVVLVSAGVLHRIGPYRMYVDLARRLAGSGFMALRFDLSGLGDSELPPDDQGELQRAVTDVQGAMDYIESQHSVQRFVLLGLCSGADDALSTAAADPRVVGAVLLDGFGFRTTGFYQRHYLRRALNPTKILAFMARQAKQVASRLTQASQRDPARNPPATESQRAPSPDIYDRQFPPASQINTQLLQLARRGARLFFMYSGGSGYFNHERQFSEMFPEPALARKVDVHFLPRADHTYTILKDREEMLTLVESWICRHFPEVETAQTPPSTRPRLFRSSSAPPSSGKERIVF